jgi:hypothetical protein
MHFEFNEKLLLFIATEINNQKFGTFMGDCQKDRKDLKLEEYTESMWTYILMNKEQYLNMHYKSDADFNRITQIPVTSYFCLSEWRHYFFKWCEFGYDVQKETPRIEGQIVQPEEVHTEYEWCKLEPYRLGVLRDKKLELNELLQKQTEILGKVEMHIEKREVSQIELNQLRSEESQDFVLISYSSPVTHIAADKFHSENVSSSAESRQQVYIQ